MKKIFLTLTIIILACYCSFAQTPIYDSTQVYDTVTDADDFYYFTIPKPCIDPTLSLEAPLGRDRILLQGYWSTDTLTVYGVAVTLTTKYPLGPISDSTPIHALLMTPLGPSPYSYYYSMHPVDSVSLYRSHPRFCWFLYEDDCNEKQSLVAPCYEFYFDTPERMNYVTDTFYVGYGWPWEIGGCLIPYGGSYDNSLPGHLFSGLGDGFDLNANDAFSPYTGYGTKVWGIAFPIIGFRCKPVRQYWLNSYTGTTATVNWSAEEPGTLFDVRLVGEDGSDTTYVTPGNTLVIQNLSDSVRYTVMLRKQCHYCTSNYDTIARSEWLSYLSFGNPTISDTIIVLPGDTLIIGGDTLVNTGDTVIVTPGEPIIIGGDTIVVNPGDSVIVNPGSHLAIIRQDDLIYRYTSLQPNPASDKVKVLSSFGISCIEAYDLKGRKVYEVRTPNSEFKVTLDVSSWPRGTYLLRILTPAGPTTKKLLIQ